MNSFEFTKPEDWSIGKRTGFLSILLLIVGTLILLDTIYTSYSIFVTSLTIVLIVVLLYMNTGVFLERGSSRIRINHFILMVWGGWQLLSYSRLVATYMTTPFGHVPYHLITGLWFVAIGFLLCVFAGLMEWKHPSVMGPQILFKNKRAGKLPPEKEYQPTVHAQPVKSRNLGPMVAGNPHPKPAGNPQPINPISNALDTEPASEEEKILLRWARHIGADGKAYEQCMRCGKYGFITAREGQGNMQFACPSCGTVFKLKK